ncbi:hypothetical protein C8J56DRAFT_1007769 [Mycena floridula]|nr:hypothetical protein C8J56DRAFT_1007769 [Mycena floridula]
MQTPSRSDLKSRTKIQKQEEMLRSVFNLLCITSFGHAGLDPIWVAIRLEDEGNESIWADGIRQTVERMNNMLFVVSLLLATSAVFITTVPPRASMVNYTLRGPYICMLGSFRLLLGGIIVALVCVLVTNKARPYWLEQVLYATRFHMYCTLIMVSYPFFSIGAAALLLAFGM